jgi:hypothetical protein
MMTTGEIFLAGLVTGVLLATMVVIAVWQRPRPPRRRRLDGDAERGWMRAVDAAYDAGRQNGLALRAPERPALRIVRRDEKGWLGTTRATDPDGKGAA